MKRIFICLFLVTGLLYSCVEEYWPELKPIDERLLVVEGSINNDLGPYTIKLSTTRSIDSIPDSPKTKADFNAISNAHVEIIDEFENSEVLSEVEPGIYKTSVDGMQGEVGVSYKVLINLPNGETYESSYEEILEPVKIESVDYTITTIDGKEGLQFKVSTVDLDEIKYLKWIVEESYEIQSPYAATHAYNGMFTNGVIFQDGDTRIINRGTPSTFPPYRVPDIDYNIDSLLNCWITIDLLNNYYISSELRSSASLSNISLHFVPYGSEKLRVKYSVMVEQHTISEKMYTHFKNIDEQNNFNPKDLYTKQPYQIRGNVVNTNNPDKATLGYFYSSGVHKKHIFAPMDPRPKIFQQYATEYCKNMPSVDYTGVAGHGLVITNNTYNYIRNNSGKEEIWPIYFSYAYIYNPEIDPEDYEMWFVALTHYCADCRTRKGSNSKPTYWD